MPVIPLTVGEPEGPPPVLSRPCPSDLKTGLEYAPQDKAGGSAAQRGPQGWLVLLSGYSCALGTIRSMPALPHRSQGPDSGPRTGLRVACEGQGPHLVGPVGGTGTPLGFWGPAPGREEASALDFAQSRILAGEEPGLCRVAQVDGRAPRRVRSTAWNLKKMPSGVPHVSVKAGLAMPSD